MPWFIPPLTWQKQFNCNVWCGFVLLFFCENIQNWLVIKAALSLLNHILLSSAHSREIASQASIYSVRLTCIHCNKSLTFIPVSLNENFCGGSARLSLNKNCWKDFSLKIPLRIFFWNNFEVLIFTSYRDEMQRTTELLKCTRFILKMISIWFTKTLPTVECFIATIEKDMRGKMFMLRDHRVVNVSLYLKQSK